MTTKQKAAEIISRLPEEVTVAEIISQLYVQLKIETGIDQLNAAQGLEHPKAKERLKKWLA